MRICLDARVGTAGGTNTFVDGFVQQLQSEMRDVADGLTFIVLAHSQQGIASPSSPEIPGSRVQELLWAQRSLPTWLREHEIDVYHSLKHVGPLVCPAKTVYRVPAVGQFDGTYPLSVSERIYWAHLAKRVYSKADLLIAVSKYVRNGLIEQLDLPPDRIVTVPNGVSSCFHQLDRDKVAEDVSPNGRPFLLSVGNVCPVKNVHVTVEAFGKLCCDRDFDHDLIVAGGLTHAYAHEVRQLVASHGLEHRVHFVGFADTNRLVHLYNAADALVHISHHEGCSFTLLEALACGTPIVAANVSSIPETVGDAAKLVDDPNDVDLLANAIECLLCGGQRSAFAQAALERSKSFTWAKCVSNTVHAYSKIGAAIRCAV